MFFKNKSEVHEKTMVSGILTGYRNELNWNKKEEYVDYYDVKGIVEFISKKFNIDIQTKDYDSQIFLNNRSAKLYNKKIGKDIGFIGEISSELLEDLDFNFKNASIFEIDLGLIIKSKSEYKYEEFSSFPYALRDLSLIVDKKVKYEEIKNIILLDKYAVDTVIIDSYEGNEIPQNKKSISIRISYQSFENTLSSKNLDKIEGNILSKLNKHLDAYIRE